VFETAPREVVVDGERAEANGGEDGAVTVEHWEKYCVGHA
jgi:hypothetical protein